MNFEFDVTLEFDITSYMYIAYPQLYEDDDYLALEVKVEVKDYKPARSAPYVKDTTDYRFYDSGDNMEADIQLFAMIDNIKTELPTELVSEFKIIDEVDRRGCEILKNYSLY